MPLKVLNENKEQCRLCGGACCKKIPGLFFPEDLGNDKEQIISNLLEMVERNQVEFVTYFGGIVVRPQQKTQDWSGRGPCIWHTDTGCVAPVKPSQCSALVPGGTWENPSCMSPKDFSEDRAVVAWSFMEDELYTLRDIHREYR
jgi:Fe-S-cluster containining protein